MERKDIRRSMRLARMSVYPFVGSCTFFRSLSKKRPTLRAVPFRLLLLTFVYTQYCVYTSYLVVYTQQMLKFIAGISQIRIHNAMNLCIVPMFLKTLNEPTEKPAFQSYLLQNCFHETYELKH